MANSADSNVGLATRVPFSAGHHALRSYFRQAIHTYVSLSPSSIITPPDVSRERP